MVLNSSHVRGSSDVSWGVQVTSAMRFVAEDAPLLGASRSGGVRQGLQGGTLAPASPPGIPQLLVGSDDT